MLIKISKSDYDTLKAAMKYYDLKSPEAVLHELIRGCAYVKDAEERGRQSYWDYYTRDHR